MTVEQMEAASHARLRRNFREMSPEERLKQVAELSRAVRPSAIRADDR